MKFSKQFLIETLDSDRDVLDEITEHGRWRILHHRVFEWEGKFYCANYTVGATEYQEESPYEYEKDEVDCPEMRPVQKIITVYELVK